jgi:hypothetical protein
VVNVVVTNLGVNASAGGITVSAPGSGAALAVEGADAGPGARVYRPGEAMARLPCCGSVTLASPVAEVWHARGWPAGAARTLAVRVTPPAGATEVVLLVRAAFVSAAGAPVYYPESGESLDQQGTPAIPRTVRILH